MQRLFHASTIHELETLGLFSAGTTRPALFALLRRRQTKPTPLHAVCTQHQRFGSKEFAGVPEPVQPGVLTLLNSLSS